MASKKPVLGCQEGKTSQAELFSQLLCLLSYGIEKKQDQSCCFFSLTEAKSESSLKTIVTLFCIF